MTDPEIHAAIESTPAGYSARIARYRTAARLLASLSDRQLVERLDGSPAIASGIGGTSSLLPVGGTPVFVKRVPLTDRERRPENFMSTANIFALPTFYQYGVGSTGFGAWRELAAHSITTDWVIDRRCECFPLMYHSRVLPGSPPPQATPEAQADLERMVAFWGGSTAVRGRLEAIAESSASVVFFLEYVPQNLHEWLKSQMEDGGAATDSAIAMVERHLTPDVAFMNAAGLFHFDAHFRNVLTDGQRLYFADLGLATSTQFDLSEAERRFLATNISHDACYAVTQLVNALVGPRTGAADRNRFIRRCADGGEGGDAGNVAPLAATIIRRDAPMAAVMNEFYWKLHHEPTTAYPVDEIRRVAALSTQR